MMKRGGAYDRVVRLLSGVYIAVGVVLLGLTLSGGGGPISVGFLLGLAFLAIGLGRLWFQRSMSSDD